VIPLVKLAVIQKVIPPYRVPVFSGLSRMYNLGVFHSRKRKSSSFTLASNLPFPNRKLAACFYYRGDTHLVQNIMPLLRFKPRVIISEFALGFVSFWILLLMRPVLGYKLIAWTHGVRADEVDNPFTRPQARLKRWVYNKVDAILTYSAGRQKVLQTHLKNSEKVFLARNTLDTNALNLIYNRLLEKEREQVKKELGFTYSFNLVYIGRLRPEKGIAFLLDAFRLISKEVDAELHIIGNGQDEVLISNAMGQGLPVRFHGPIYDEEQTGRLLYACDLLLNPGMVGLSIVHGFCFALPCITLEMQDGWPQHSPEVEFLQDGVNGMLLTKDSFAHQVALLLQDHQRLEAMRAAALNTARSDCSMQIMLDGFRDCISFTLKSK
jgi:glycosyltransferase involved in cell wall biosynthesis